MKQRIGFAFIVAGALVGAGCSGGGGTSSGTPAVPATSNAVAPAGATRMMDISFAGTATLARSRSIQSLAGTAVTATYNGKTVATGTLDANGHATLIFTAEVPRGATVVVTAGSVTATIVLAQSDDGTAAQVQVNSDGSLTVSTAAEHPGASPAASPAPGGESSVSQEDHGGNPTVISTTMTTLPANLPISIVANCNVVTVAPVSGPLPHVLIEMKVRDSDDTARFHFEGPLSGPVSFPVPSGAVRIRIRIVTPTGATQLDIQGPITASTTTSAGTPCPSAPPSAAPSASSSPSAEPSEKPFPAASASPNSSPSPHP